MRLAAAALLLALVRAALLRMLLLLPLQAPFEVSCCPQQTLMMGAVAMGMAMVAAVAVAPAVRVEAAEAAVAAVVLGPALSQAPRQPMAMRQMRRAMDPATKQGRICPRG